MPGGPHNGNKTPVATKLKFRAEYLVNGHIHKASAICGISPSLGKKFARDFEKDPEFLADRRAMFEGYLVEAITARQEIMRVAKKRAEKKKADVYKDQGVVIDKRPDWAKIVLDCEKNASNLAKLLTPDTTARPESMGPVVVVNLQGTANVSAPSEVVKSDESVSGESEGVEGEDGDPEAPTE